MYEYNKHFQAGYQESPYQTEGNGEVNADSSLADAHFFCDRFPGKPFYPAQFKHFSLLGAQYGQCLLQQLLDPVLRKLVCRINVGCPEIRNRAQLPCPGGGQLF